MSRTIRVSSGKRDGPHDDFTTLVKLGYLDLLQGLFAEN